MESEAVPELPNRPRVLIVEDEALIAFTLDQRLRNGGARIVGPFASAQAALDALAIDGKIDAAVLDIKLREGDVYRLADWLQAAGVPFAFATGWSPDAIPARYRGAPVWTKPIHDQDVLEWLAGLGRG
jgi:CheY-like chemotaxis protein